MPTLDNIVSGIVGGGLVWLLSIVRDGLVAERDRWREWRAETRSQQLRQRDRLVSLYDAAVGSAQNSVWTLRRLTFQLAGEDPQQTKQKLDERSKDWSERLDHAAIPLLLEPGAQAFNERFQDFSQLLVRYRIELAHPDVQPTVTLDDLQTSADLVLTQARDHLAQLENVPERVRPSWVPDQLWTWLRS